MRALVLTGPASASVRDLPDPRPSADEVVVRVDAVGICGTDRELFLGTMAYFQSGEARYPLVPGHEWSGTITKVGEATSLAVGTRVVGDVFISCQACRACADGAPNACPSRYEVGVRGGWDGAAAQYVRVPARAVYVIPDGLPATAAVFAEPAVTSLHAVERAGVTSTDTVLIVGTGTLGLLALQIARSIGADVDAIGPDPDGLSLAAQLGATACYSTSEESVGGYDVVIEAAGSPRAASMAIRASRRGGRVALIGLSGAPASIDPTDIVLGNRSVYGVLGGPGRFPSVLGMMAGGSLQTEPLVNATGTLDDAVALLGTSPHRGRPKNLIFPNGNP